MADNRHSSSVSFDDIPGCLPTTSIRESADIQDVANVAVKLLNDVRFDVFTEDAMWRDLLCFTGTYRTFHSRSVVFEAFSTLSIVTGRSTLRCKEGRLHRPRLTRSLDVSWIDVDVAFTVDKQGLRGEGSAIVSVITGTDGQVQIWMVRSWLESFFSHGNPDYLQSLTETTNDAALVEGARRASSEHGNVADGVCSIYDVIIVGGGQAGLSTAGRLKALGIQYLVLEQHPEIGDVWVNRPESLRWHTTKLFGALPFDKATYTEEDDYLLPKDRIGAGHKAWSERYGINIWTSATVDTARWNDSEKIWTIDISSAGKGIILTARNLVLAP
ncbi:hypothetical protein LTR86_011281, partial [Recurvomyces mirabilis]